MRVSETIYCVRDMDAAVQQYTEAFGFTLLSRQDWGWALLDGGNGQRVGLVLAKWMREEGDDLDRLPSPRLGVQTDDIDANVARLRAAGIPVTDPQGPAGQTRTATFTDADGNLFFLWQDA